MGARRGPMNGDGGTGSFVCIKLELDFHCRGAKRGDGLPGELTKYDEEQYSW